MSKVEHKQDWNTACTYGGVYRIKAGKPANKRVSHDSWMQGRLKKDDLIVCTSYSGNDIHKFILIKILPNGWVGIPESKFSAHSNIGQYVHTVGDSDFNKLVKGEKVSFKETKIIDKTPDFLKQKI